MKISLLLLFFSLSFTQIIAQSSVILPNGNVIPSFTLANRPSTNPLVGQLIYQTDGTTGLYVWNGTAWVAVSNGSGTSGTVTSVTTSAPLSVTNGTTAPALSISQANGSTNGFLSSADWSTFNNKQNALSNASTSTNGILTSTDWTTFNNKQNLLPQANSTTNGFLTSADWNTFNNKFSLPSLTNGSLLFSNSTTISENNSSLNWNNMLNRLDIKGLNDGSVNAGYTNWIAQSVGGSAGNRVVTGVQNGNATIGGHTNLLDGWAKLVINPAGPTAIGALQGVGTRMVVANADGEVSTQPIPTGNVGTVTNVSATLPISVSNGTSTPTVAISQANTTTDGFLSSVDWNTFNAKQSPLSNANGSTSGILTSTDWTTFNNKFNLPALTSGSILFSNGSTVAQNNTKLFWNNGNSRLGIGVNNPDKTLDVNGEGGMRVTSTNDGTGTTDWIAGNFGGTAGDRVVLGVNEGRASVGAHNTNLNSWVDLNLNPGGNVKTTNNHYVGFVTGTPTVTAKFEVAKKITAYNGNYFSSMGANSGVTCLANGGTSSCLAALDGSNGSYVESPINATQVSAGNYYAAGKTIRRVEVYIGANGRTSLSGTITITAFNSSAYGTPVYTLGTLNFTSSGTHVINLTNTNSYIYYKVSVSNVTSNLGNEYTPWLHEIGFFGEYTTTTQNPGGFTVTESGTAGVNIATPANTLDVNGGIRMRNGAAANTIMVGNENGDASWASTLPAHRVSGTAGLAVSSTNSGTGSTDWIAFNAGGISGDRVVAGTLNGKATIGGHNQDLNAWANLVINNGSGTVMIGGENVTPAALANNGAHGRPLAINGSVRQGYYIVPVSVPANGVSYVTWNHNLGYGPIVMMSTDQNGGGNNMDYVVVTTLNNNANETVFVLRNHGGVQANGALRWILVW